jgi:hypothetical protein
MLDDSVVNRAIYSCLVSHPEGALGWDIRASVRKAYAKVTAKQFMSTRIKYLKEKGYIIGWNRRWYATKLFHKEASTWSPKKICHDPNLPS